MGCAIYLSLLASKIEFAKIKNSSLKKKLLVPWVAILGIKI
jgi:hypothetical protein